MDSDEDYVKQWVECEREDKYTPSEWFKAVRSFIQIELKHLTSPCTADVLY